MAAPRVTGWSTVPKAERGYGKEWDIKRKAVLHRDGHRCQCSYCKAKDRMLWATEVDHIVSRVQAKRLGWSEERTESLENLQAINRDCHRRKTKEERGHKYRPQRAIGVDGFPL